MDLHEFEETTAVTTANLPARVPNIIQPLARLPGEDTVIVEDFVFTVEDFVVTPDAFLNAKGVRLELDHVYRTLVGYHLHGDRPMSKKVLAGLLGYDRYETFSRVLNGHSPVRLHLLVGWGDLALLPWQALLLRPGEFRLLAARVFEARRRYLSGPG